MEDYITREEHKGSAERMEAEDTRQDRRIGTLEEAVRQTDRDVKEAGL